jgi:hypothetical protein
VRFPFTWCIVPFFLLLIFSLYFCASTIFLYYKNLVVDSFIFIILRFCLICLGYVDLYLSLNIFQKFQLLFKYVFCLFFSLLSLVSVPTHSENFLAIFAAIISKWSFVKYFLHLCRYILFDETLSSYLPFLF